MESGQLLAGNLVQTLCDNSFFMYMLNNSIILKIFLYYFILLCALPQDFYRKTRQDFYKISENIEVNVKKKKNLQ